ncbi:MAG: hypothetical protein KME15_04065 [Drouetiella hepatica Uher 2000/2452]|jgi:hypothetical protein|uniref:Uncharacterized protein n=1 Tax=Drouetiella hepatica Uher 2000/2452 TaxID=904376 RepID=A0A951Q9Q4_9CYAN|nr:hypothetical protein [Drouetiella hepatica Uher 2000/2452]
MVSTIPVQDSAQPHARYRARRFHTHRLKRPWSYGRGYGVIVGVALLVLVSLAIVHLHQIWQGRSQRLSQ